MTKLKGAFTASNIEEEEDEEEDDTVRLLTYNFKKKLVADINGSVTLRSAENDK